MCRKMEGKMPYLNDNKNQNGILPTRSTENGDGIMPEFDEPNKGGIISGNNPSENVQPSSSKHVKIAREGDEHFSVKEILISVAGVVFAILFIAIGICLCLCIVVYAEKAYEDNYLLLIIFANIFACLSVLIVIKQFSEEKELLPIVGCVFIIAILLFGNIYGFKQRNKAIESDFVYELNVDGTYSINVSDSLVQRKCIQNGTLTIPSVRDGKIVTIINEPHFCADVEKVIIPASVKEIHGTFEGKIKEVIFDDNSQISEISDKLFYNCSSLTKVSFGENSNIKSIGKYAFSDTNLVNIIIPESVTYIEEYAFYGCRILKTVSYGNNSNLKSIGTGAFKNCYSLTDATIPNSVIKIGSSAFSFCTDLKNITVGNSVTTIGAGAFSHCNSLTAVYITDLAKWCAISLENKYENPLAVADKMYLNGNLVKNLVIPNSVKNINKYAFYGCNCLTSITIPNSVTTIGDYAFGDCSNIMSVMMGDSVTTIGQGVFQNCTSLTNVMISNSLTSIGANAFEGCTSLANIMIPNSVARIGSYAFADTNLISVTIPDSVTSIGAHAFEGCDELMEIIFSDETNWYCTDNISEWESKTNGTMISVNNPSKNAMHFTSKYGYYLYKL